MPPLLLSLALTLLAPWIAGDVPPVSSAPPRLPVAMVASPADPAAPEGFDATGASRQVVEGAAARLHAMGFAVQPDGDGFLVIPSPAPRGGGPARATVLAGLPSPERGLSLSFGFGAGASRLASGSETRFGGEGDEAWRLAAATQRHLVGGLRDVLGYQSYDRGVVERRPRPDDSESPDLGVQAPWVAAYPLFATNQQERALLEWPDTLDLLAAALADGVADYLSPTSPTPPRDARWGWRVSSLWQPVTPRTVYQAPHGTRLALTFDGGASSAPTPAILKALREAGVRATMFMTADFVQKNPDLVVQMARDGHEFGNHSSTHPDMTTLPDRAIVAELERLESALQTLTGRSTRPWFRPPFGASNDRVARVAAEQGYYTIMWTADSADWRPEVAPATVQRRLLAYAAPGAILIQHLGAPQSAQVMAETLALLKERGFTFGTLSEVLGSLD